MARAASSAGTSTPIDRAMPERWSIGKPYSANYYYDEITTDELPPDQVDLSDYWVVKVVKAGIGAKDRQARWPAVFTSKMLKSSYINKVYYCQRSIAWPLHGHTLSVPNPRNLARSLSVLSFETSPVSSSSLVPETSPVGFSSRDLPHRPTDSDSPSYQTSSDPRTLALLLSPLPCSDKPLPPSPLPHSIAVRRAEIANSTDVSLSPSRLPTLREPSQPLFDAEVPDPVDDLIEAQLENATPLAVLSGLDHPLRDHKAWQIRARDATTIDEESNEVEELRHELNRLRIELQVSQADRAKADFRIKTLVEFAAHEDQIINYLSSYFQAYKTTTDIRHKREIVNAINTVVQDSEQTVDKLDTMIPGMGQFITDHANTQSLINWIHGNDHINTP